MHVHTSFEYHVAYTDICWMNILKTEDMFETLRTYQRRILYQFIRLFSSCNLIAENTTWMKYCFEIISKIKKVPISNQSYLYTANSPTTDLGGRTAISHGSIGCDYEIQCNCFYTFLTWLHKHTLFFAWNSR